VDSATIWRWDQALASSGVAGLVPARRSPKQASKLIPEAAERIQRGATSACMQMPRFGRCADAPTAWSRRIPQSRAQSHNFG
jgi:hypothetical protein